LKEIKKKRWKLAENKKLKDQGSRSQKHWNEGAMMKLGLIELKKKKLKWNDAFCFKGEEHANEASRKTTLYYS